MREEMKAEGIRRRARCGKGKKLYGGLLVLTVLLAAWGLTAFAAAREEILLIFDDQYEEGVMMEPELEVRGSGAEFVSLDWSRKVEDWTPGTKVTGKLTLAVPLDGTEDSSYWKVSAIGASVSGKKLNDGYLEVTVKYYPVAWLGETESAGWKDAEHTIASWKRVKGATGYHLRLYRDNRIVQTMTVSGTTKDLREYMEVPGEYYYDVCASGKNADDRKYRKDGGYVTSTDSIVAQEDIGESGGRWLNYAEGKKYLKEDETMPAGCWEKIDRNWYYFDPDGFAATGWRQVNGLWYYMDASGVMLTGWQQINGIWYYLNEDGSMAVGWKEATPGEWYYLNEDGSMAADTVVDGWRLDASGKRAD